ncbi:hypothetical protein PN836_002795 [Ningiella sp. W23]|uniref:hypothetical protein n=1 Tax=Ningiella sp. W23 TaxID=3023715 RepID=UPI0037578533
MKRSDRTEMTDCFYRNTHFTMERTILHESLGTYRYLLFAQAIPIWTSILYILFTMILLFQILTKHIKRYLRVRLFEIELLKPLSEIIFTNFFVAISIIAVYPLNALVYDLPFIELVLMFVFSCLTLALLCYPVIVTRQTLLIRKEQMLERLNHSLSEQMSTTSALSNNRRLVDDDSRVKFISDLLLVRKEIGNTGITAIDLPFSFKLSLLMLIPLVSWVGAALVSQLLKVAVPI